MKLLKPLILCLTVLCVSSCDPSHDIRLENRSDKNIVVILYPYIEDQKVTDGEFLQIERGDLIMTQLSLKPGESLTIGSVAARYTPEQEDLDIEHLEIFSSRDTIRLAGKEAIFSAIGRVKKLDWRLIVK